MNPTTTPTQTSPAQATLAQATPAQANMELFHDDGGNDTGSNYDTLIKATLFAETLADRPIPGVTMSCGAPATYEEVSKVHSKVYLNALLHGAPEHLASSNSLGWDDRLFGAVLASTGSVRSAVLTAMSNRTITGATASGLHHARRGTGAGNCTLNGLVVAALAAKTAGARRVLVLDLDAHCGGGTAELIEDVDGLMQIDISVNHFDWYESRDNAELLVVGAADYLETIAESLEGVHDPATIDVVIYNAGMDPHERAGGISGITTEVLRQREELVMAWANTYDLPLAFVFAGGYQSGSFYMDDVVDLHRLTVEAAANAVAERFARRDSEGSPS